MRYDGTDLGRPVHLEADLREVRDAGRFEPREVARVVHVAEGVHLGPVDVEFDVDRVSYGFGHRSQWAASNTWGGEV